MDAGTSRRKGKVTMTATKSNGNSAEHELQRQHRELVEKYSKTRGAERAGVARAIHSTQVDLRLAGLSYEAWSKPQARSKFELSESALRQQIEGLRSLLASDDVEAPT